MIDEIDGALGDGKGAVDVILKMVCMYMHAGTGFMVTWGSEI